MEPELSCQRNFLACLMSQTFGMFKTGQDNLSNIVSERTVLQEQQESRYYDYHTDVYQTNNEKHSLE